MNYIKSFLFLTGYAKTIPASDLVSHQRFRLFRISMLFAVFVYLTLLFQMWFVMFHQPTVQLLISALFFAGFINYFALAIHKSQQLAYFLMLVLFYSLLHITTYFSGGIMNSGVIYLPVLILSAYMLLGTRGGLWMCGVAILHVVYFYFISTQTNLVSLDLIGNAPGMVEMDFLITGILSISMLAAQSSYIEKSKHAVIADIKSKNEVLQQERKLLRILIDNIPDYIYVKDKESRHLINNKANVELVGADDEAATLGKTIVDYLGEAVGGRFLEDDQKVLHSGVAIVNREEPLLKQDGEQRWLLTTKIPIKDEQDQVTGLVGISRDITDLKNSAQKLEILNNSLQRKAEELTTSNNELEHFAYIASHDLQEPLRMVESFMVLLLKKHGDALPDTAKEYIDFAIGGARRMKNLIHDLLEYSRVGSIEEMNDLVDLNVVLSDIELDFKQTIKQESAKLTIAPLPVVMGNALLLQQVFQNLIGNAIKYKGEATVQIDIGFQEDRGKYIFYIKDNGIGIDPKYFNKIFIIFQRLHTADLYSGTGIGLAICKKIIEKHQGEIWVHSELGKGSTFYFSLPVPEVIAPM